MHKSCFTIALVSVLIAASGVPCPAAPPELVVVQSADIKPFNDTRAGFERTCGCDIADVIITSADRQDIVSIIRRTNPDGVLAIGLDALARVKNVHDVPLFYTMTAGTGHPLEEMKNLSGVSMSISPEVQIQTVLEILPKTRRIGIIYDVRHSAHFVERVARYAAERKVEIVAQQVSDSRDVLTLLNGLKGRIDVLIMLPDMTVINKENINGMLLFSFSVGVPIFTFSEKYVEMGALAALTVEPFDLGAQTGEIAHMLLVGAERGPIRMYARKRILFINPKIAQKLGISILDAILKNSVIVK
ncbi:MAG TPA: ABC transporter substrate binding protein [Dissulfurispiraceae bacterium]|nr:ABC transporter substrate binding protein [Dissulfurispiraceae bacterium]